MNAISFSKLVVTSYEIKGYPELARRHTLEEPQRKTSRGEIEVSKEKSLVVTLGMTGR